MKAVTTYVALAAAVAFSVAAPAAEPRRPSKAWVVNFDADQCVASRNYGTDEDPLYLVIKAPPLGGVMQMAVMQRGGSADPEQLEARLEIDGQPLKTSALLFKPREAQLRTHLINLDTAQFAPLRHAKTLRIRTLGLDEAFKLSLMESLLETMDECVSDLRNVWNVSATDADPPRVKEPATANLRGLIKSSDYPPVARQQRLQGTVTLALLIDERGQISDCTVIKTSGAAALDAQSCGILVARARFKPAVGLDGKAAKHAHIQTIDWRLGL